MSWIIGLAGAADKLIIDKINLPASGHLYKLTEKSLLILSGGNKNTCKFYRDESNAEGCVTVGVGIDESSDQAHFMSGIDWHNSYLNNTIKNINGHFVSVHWDKNNLRIYTDRLGLRDIYFSKIQNNALIFSTRLDWLAKLTGLGINFTEFGSRWLLFNQISPNSVIHNIERMTAGTEAVVNRVNNNISIKKNLWRPEISGVECSFKEFSNTLDDVISIPGNNKFITSLSLSGGMDSRLLLSFLLKRKDTSWYSHTFGDENHPDSIVANKIISDLGIKHEHINLPLLEIDDCILGITEYVSHTIVNNAASGYLQLRHYEKLKGRNEVVIDGGFGEIWRREFFNRLLLKGRDSLITKNIKKMIPYLSIPRADIFNADINKKMLAGCELQLENIFNDLPDMNEIGVENWIDLFAVKTRLGNYYSSEQSRLDSIILCYMSFIQPVLLKNLFNVDVSQRKNGRLFRAVIKNNFKELSDYRLAKGDMTHPYPLSTIQSRIWSKTHKIFKMKRYADHSAKKLIENLTPFIQDLIFSKDVKECGYYNYSKLAALSDSLVKGSANDRELAELDWWLAFDLFRQQIKS
jgi:hypothetical protein